MPCIWQFHVMLPHVEILAICLECTDVRRYTELSARLWYYTWPSSNILQMCKCASVQAWHLNSFRTFVMASALIILLMGLGVFLYCYQQSRRAFLDEAELQVGAFYLSPCHADYTCLKLLRDDYNHCQFTLLTKTLLHLGFSSTC